MTRPPAVVEANYYSRSMSNVSTTYLVTSGGIILRRNDNFEAAERRRMWKLAWVSSRGPRAHTRCGFTSNEVADVAPLIVGGAVVTLTTSSPYVPLSIL